MRGCGAPRKAGGLVRECGRVVGVAGECEGGCEPVASAELAENGTGSAQFFEQQAVS